MSRGLSFYDKIANRLQERFGFKKPEAKAIAKEVFLALHDIVAESDEVLIPYVGRLRLIEVHWKNFRRYSLRLKTHIEGPITRHWYAFKANQILHRKMKWRKYRALPSVLAPEENNENKV